MRFKHAPTRFAGLWRVLTALVLAAALSGVPLAAYSAPTPDPTAPVAATAAEPAPAAVALVPPASPTTAVITVKTGGDRTAQDVVGPLAGVTLQLYNGTTEPTTADADAFATCTSDAAGDCSFVVPDVGTGGANLNRRFGIVQTGAPAGWRINTTLRTERPSAQRRRPPGIPSGPGISCGRVRPTPRAVSSCAGRDPSATCRAASGRAPG